MIAVMTEDFVSVRREHQGLNVINVCRDISGTAWAVNVSNSESRPCPATLLPLRLYAITCSYLRAENEQNALQTILPEPFWTLPDDNSKLTVPSSYFNILSVFSVFLSPAPGEAPTEICKYVCLANCEISFLY